MYAIEALLAAYEATGHVIYLDRAEKIAGNITLRQARLSHGLVWEHFHRDWSVDWHYNESDSSNIFRPWGFQPGHQTEWAKLLLILERHRALPWLAPRAIELFDGGFNRAWDSRHGRTSVSNSPTWFNHVCASMAHSSYWDGPRRVMCGSISAMTARPREFTSPAITARA